MNNFIPGKLYKVTLSSNSQNPRSEFLVFDDIGHKTLPFDSVLMYIGKATMEDFEIFLYKNKIVELSEDIDTIFVLCSGK